MNAKRAAFAALVAAFAVVPILHFSPARTATAAAPQDNRDTGACAGLPGFAALKIRDHRSHGCGNERFEQSDCR